VNFPEAERYLLSLGNEVETMKLGLDSTRKLLSALGDPQKTFLKVQVAGTNGKGSVCAFLGSICREAGVKAGVFTSPHLVSITERIQIDLQSISEEAFARHATTVRDAAEKLLAKGSIDHVPTFFEQVTAIALLAFARSQVKVAILETGLGGRLDATTAADAEIAAITRIDLDHQEYLGETLQDIAAEKAAIIHGGSLAFIGEQPSGVNDIILRRCADVGVTPVFADFVDVRRIDDKLVLVTDATDHELDRIGLAGRHQIENAKLAILIAEELSRRFAMLKAHIARGIERARHAGRLEYDGRFLFDGAHNVGGARALRAFLDEYEDRPITLVYAAMKGKDVRSFAEIVFPRAEHIIVTRVDSPRSMTADEIAEALPTIPGICRSRNAGDALRLAAELTPRGGIILVTGSLYLIGEAKEYLRSEI
jgi:dihydrofolate synthase/folylpolyglutamate synthase